MPISLPIDAAANELLSRDPLALLIGMLLDQQMPLEKAFSGPYDLARRLGHEPTAQELADYDPAALTAVFRERPALHRYPRAMAARTQELARLVTGRYGGDAAQLWQGAASGAELVRRIAQLPGFGPAKAQIFAALLGKQFGVRPPGWQEATGQFGQQGSRLSVADITGSESLAQVRAYKQQLNAAAGSRGGQPPAAGHTRSRP